MVKAAGLSHGPVKNFISQAWLARHPEQPVDIRYQHMKYRLYPQDNVTDRKLLFGSRHRDREELEALRQSVSGGGTFIDIGANIGHYTLMAASFGAACIVAVEPNPDALERLGFNTAANNLHDRVDIVQTALGETEGEANLYVPVDGDMGGGRLSDSEIHGRQVRVSIRPLLSVLDERGINHIDALKIDVEGMEDRVLFPFFETAPASLWPQLIIIEHTSAPEWDRNIQTWLLEHGYKTAGKTHSNLILQLSTDKPDHD
jgi:FkbM family methyltransferase